MIYFDLIWCLHVIVYVMLSHFTKDFPPNRIKIYFNLKSDSWQYAKNMCHVHIFSPSLYLDENKI